MNNENQKEVEKVNNMEKSYSVMEYGVASPITKQRLRDSQIEN